MREHKVPDADRLHHMQAAVDFILAHTNGLEEDEFYRDEVLKRAVVRELEIVGEAANMLSEDLREKHPSVPWRQIIATRNRVIHEYFHVNYTTVWGIIQKDLPDLQAQINEILKGAD